MVPQPTAFSQSLRRIGVGIDTSRCGHYAAFLRENLQPADAEFPFAESGQGYQALRERLQRIARRDAPCSFVVRVDAAAYGSPNPTFKHSLNFCSSDGDRLPSTWATVSV